MHVRLQKIDAFWRALHCIAERFGNGLYRFPACWQTEQLHRRLLSGMLDFD